VEIVRDGRSFATRTVRSLQRGAVIFILTASFQRPEPSPLHHSMPSPIHLVPKPEDMHTPSPQEYAQTIYQRIVDRAAIPTKQTKMSPVAAMAKSNASNGNGEELIKSLSKEFAARPIDFRYVSDKEVKASARTSQPTEYRQYSWFKTNGSISNDPRMHAVALAYASDHNLLSTAVGAHRGKWNFPDISVMVSLDHIIYFHDVFPV
jgi:acyl-CoA thioesterase II